MHVGPPKTACIHKYTRPAMICQDMYLPSSLSFSLAGSLYSYTFLIFIVVTGSPDVLFRCVWTAEANALFGRFFPVDSSGTPYWSMDK